MNITVRLHFWRSLWMSVRSILKWFTNVPIVREIPAHLCYSQTKLWSSDESSGMLRIDSDRWVSIERVPMSIPFTRSPLVFRRFNAHEREPQLSSSIFRSSTVNSCLLRSPVVVRKLKSSRSRCIYLPVFLSDIMLVQLWQSVKKALNDCNSELILTWFS